MIKPTRPIEKFKQCPFCQTWFSDHDILFERAVMPMGMLIDSMNLDSGMFFFHHERQDCGTTFAIRSEEFSHLIDEPIPPEAQTLSDQCEGHCIDVYDTQDCSANCKWAPYRRLLRAMLKARKIEPSDVEEIVIGD